MASSDVTITNVRAGGTVQMSINGKRIEMRGDRLYVNGQEYGPLGSSGKAEPLPPPPQITLDKDGVIKGPVHGDLYITGPGPVTLRVEGNIDGSVSVENGDVTCRSVGGSVRAEGAVTAGSVGGSVTTEGNVSCGSVGGSVRAEGTVQRR